MGTTDGFRFASGASTEVTLTSDDTSEVSATYTSILSTIAPEGSVGYSSIFWLYYVPTGLVILVGLVCDILSVVVFAASRTLRRTTTGHYLIALMIADTSFLIGELLKWMTYSIDGKRVLGFNFDKQDGPCRLVYFIRYSAKLLSAWLTVVITLERFFTVVKPLRVAQISTIPKARSLIALVTVACIGLGAFPFWTVGARPHEGVIYCIITDPIQYEIWLMVVIRLGSLIVPCVIILVLTVMILVHLNRADQTRHTISSASGKHVQRQLTAMLLAVTFSFIVLRLPYTVCWYINNYSKELRLTGATVQRIFLARHVTEVIATANYATNFFLFCLCGSSFRAQLRRFCEKKSDFRSSTRSSQVNSYNGRRQSIASITLEPNFDREPAKELYRK